MKQRALTLLVTLSVLSFINAPPLFAQAAVTSSISGTVVDTAGGAMPGVTVTVKQAATGATFDTVTNAEGVFSVPSLQPGVYTVTATLTGFKTGIVEDVRVLPGASASIKVTMEVGQLEETITVTSSAELINTQTPVVQATLNADQLNRMPTPTRNALNAVTFLPGVNTATTNRESRINGLPESFVNITLDGVSNNDNFLRSSDSFFASVTPRQDAVEAVTINLAAAGANVGGSGAVTINFATRSGTNRFSGSAYEYYRHWDLNSNYFFNELEGLGKNEIKLNQYGARVGGPISIPGLFDGRDKAFFFFHYEQLRFPNSFTRTRRVLDPRALDGTFRYLVGTEIREVNVLDLAQKNGQLTTVDPTIMGLLQKIQAATATTGSLSPRSDPLTMDYTWLSPGKLFEHQPTLRIDYNLTQNHTLSGSTQTIWAERDPDYLNGADARFSGAPNYRFFHSKRPLHSFTLRSTLTNNIVNEVRAGITALGGASYFGDNRSNGPQTFEDQGGFAIDFDQNIGLTNWYTQLTPSWRSAPTYSIENTLNWQKGKHSLMFGGTWLRATAWERAQQMVPGIQIGFDTSNDPARGMFTGGSSGTIRGANTNQLRAARQLYALLTGRVISVTGLAALDPDTNTYVAFGPRTREGRIDMFSGFMQDSWRLTPAFTLNAGLRYDLQLPFTAVNDVMSAASMESVCGISGLGSGGTYSRCNFFQPGASGGTIPEFIPLTKGTQGYETDTNNFAPNVGVAWRPNVQEGWLRKFLGDPEQATLRAGFSMAYERQGMSQFTGVFGPNPGATLDLERNEDIGNLVPEGEKWPVLLSQRERLYNAAFEEKPRYPIAVRPGREDDLNAFAPDLKIAYAGTWTVSFQRSITRDTAVDIRYVGTRGWSQWSTLDYNQIRGESLINNGFLDEFRLAMNNLTANNLSGNKDRIGSFAYFGPGTGTDPLPTYFAYLEGTRDYNDSSKYKNTDWGSSSFTTDLVRSNPNPVASAYDLDGSSTRRDRASKAGLPANLFVLNPHVDDVDVTDSGAFSDYHALQIELRRRLSRGLSANVNYQYAVEGGSAFDGFSFGRVMSPSENVRHAIKTQWDWTIPLGRGQRFGANMNPILDGILGGWSINGVGRIQSRVINFGNVRLVGMSVADLTKVYKHQVRTNPETGERWVYNLPQDIIDNTRRAFNVDPESPTGYSSLGAPTGKYFAPANSADCLQLRPGDCAPRALMVRSPWFTRFDIGVTKRFPLRGSVNFEIRADILNVFDNINFDPAEWEDNVSNNTPGYLQVNEGFSSEDFGRVTTAYRDPSNTYDPGGRLGQVMFRINW